MNKSFDTAIKRMQERAAILRGEKGTLYRPDITGIVQEAIQQNADPSWDGSPAKTAAINSVNNWQHSGELHQLLIMSYLFANYRQYGCGGVTIAVLVVLLQHNRQQISDRFAQVLHEVR